MNIRRADVNDTHVLVELSRETFTQTFGHLYPAQDLQEFLDSAYDSGAQRELLASSEHAVWLAEDSGQAVGYVLAGPCTLPHEDVAPGDGEVKRLYVLHSHQGQGVGTQLLDVALEWLGARQLWIGVWSENYGAQRLYGRYGFSKAGEYLFEVGECRDLEFILRRTVAG